MVALQSENAAENPPASGAAAGGNVSNAEETAAEGTTAPQQTAYFGIEQGEEEKPEDDEETQLLEEAARQLRLWRMVAAAMGVLLLGYLLLRCSSCSQWCVCINLTGTCRYASSKTKKVFGLEPHLHVWAEQIDRGGEPGVGWDGKFRKKQTARRAARAGTEGRQHSEAWGSPSRQRFVYSY